MLKRIIQLHSVQKKQNVLTLSVAGNGSLGISGDEWDADPWVLGCPNGVVDLKTGGLRPGRPLDYIRTVANVEWKGIAGLTWPQVDLENRIIRLEVGSTKNKEGRTVYLDDNLITLFKKQWENRKQQAKLTPYVFLNRSGDGRIREIRKPWNEACRTSQLGYGYRISEGYIEKWQEKLPAGPIFHDFRRTAVRNMVRAGGTRTGCHDDLGPKDPIRL